MRIIYIDLDSCSPSHLHCYGYSRKTSPAIDALASEGVRLTNVYTSDAPCLPSRTGFYSGRFGIQTGVVGHGGTASQPKVQGKSRGFIDWFGQYGLAHQLQNCGLYTALISSFGQRHAAHWFYAGFNEVQNCGDGGMESAEKVTPLVHTWLDNHAKQDNWYLHVNYWDPHTPYRVPASFGDPFAKEPLPDWCTPKLIAEHNKIVGPHTSMEVSMYDDKESPHFPRHPGKITDMDSMRKMIDGYDTGIHYADHQIKLIIAQLKAAGVYDDTAIIISADHGENMGNLGIYGEHATADHGTCNIPVIIKWPGGASGIVDESLHYHLDLAPTLMELFDKPAPKLWDGASYAQTIKTGKPQGQEQLIIGQGAHVCQRSVRSGKWLYMRTYHDGFHLFADEMLYDIEADPMEWNDLAKANPEICRRLAGVLQDWHDAQMRRMIDAGASLVDPMWTVMAEGGPLHAQHEGPNSPLPKYLARLEATGRGAGAAELRKKYAAFLTGK